MNIVTCLYGDNCEPYVRQLKVMLFSAYKNIPDLNIILYHSRSLKQEHIDLIKSKIDCIQFVELEPENFDEKLISSTQKLYYWNKMFQDIEDGEYVLMDCDTLIVRDFSNLFKKKFDLGFTYRFPNSKFRVNAGVMFFRKNKQSSNFFEDWYKKTLEVSDSDKKIHYHESRFGSVDQGILTEMLYIEDDYVESKSERIGEMLIMGFPCHYYNLSEQWEKMNEHTAVVHFKSGWRHIICTDKEYTTLREVCNSYSWEGEKRATILSWSRAFNTWKSYEKMAGKFYGI